MMKLKPKSLAHLLNACLLSGVFGTVEAANSLCPEASASQHAEGNFRIAERAFTEHMARRELDKLNRLLGPDGIEADPIAWETAFVYIESWYLKRQAVESIFTSISSSAVRPQERTSAHLPQA